MKRSVAASIVLLVLMLVSTSAFAVHFTDLNGRADCVGYEAWGEVVDWDPDPSTIILNFNLNGVSLGPIAGTTDPSADPVKPFYKNFSISDEWGKLCGDVTVTGTIDVTDGGDTIYDSGTIGPIDLVCPCGGGCTLTQGYWKNHSIYGPAPYDPIWAQVGEDTPFFGSGKSWYQAINMSSRGGNAYWILARQYVAAYLNDLAGADMSDAANMMHWASLLLSNADPNVRIRGIWRGRFIAVADALDQFNKGFTGPGHCTD